MTKIVSAFILCLMALTSLSAKDILHSGDSKEIRFIDKTAVQIDPVFQSELRAALPWQQFISQNPGWLCQFDEDNQKPMRAFGPGILVQGLDPVARALTFVTEQLEGFEIPMTQLSQANLIDNGKHHQVFFTQQLDGKEVLYSKLMVKMTYDGRVISWTAVVHDDLDIDTTPSLSPLSAAQAASGDLTGVTGMDVRPDLKILSVPGHRSYTHHLVYEVETEVLRDNGMPALYLSQVDAHTGDLLQRIDQYHTYCSHGLSGHESCEASELPVVEVNLSGSTITLDPSEPNQTVAYPSMRVQIDGEQYTSDEQGNFITTIDGPVDATVALRGQYAEVYDQITGEIPDTVLTLMDGQTDISLHDYFSDVELSGYYNTTVMHNYMKTVLPEFTGLDYALPVNINITPHDCNAFYNGFSINFYVGADECVSLVTVADVVFHEYGHGINGKFYQSLGGSFANGGMNEGYADVWAFFVNTDPVLGDGNNPIDAEAYVRRYDENPKVYPQDLVGEVHADGEIIAGAWWDTYLLLGNDMDYTTELFSLAYSGLQATVANGNEGQAFLDVLIDVLEADDDDGNILNGTPNGAAITEAFAIHGITFLTTAEIIHGVIEDADAEETILVEAALDISDQFTDYLDGVALNYRVNDDQEWIELLMEDLDNNDYQVEIPAQEDGAIISYYIGVKDIYGNLSGVTPQGAHLEIPTLPHFILVGYDLLMTYDSDDEEGFDGFDAGVDSDNATTGLWEQADPVGSYNNDTEVAPNSQTTDGGEFCFVTGNSLSANDGIGVNDVDGGTTTLISYPIDLSDLQDPVFTYMRWYTNAAGANPGADWWQVQVSGDEGQTWVYVEDTKVADASWRRNVFRVSDYVDVTDEFMIKFNASDSLRPGTNLEGGSLIEAALDDFMIYERIGTPERVDELDGLSELSLYPVPAVDQLSLDITMTRPSEVWISVQNSAGQVVIEQALGLSQGQLHIPMDISSLAAGQYTLELRTTEGSVSRQLQVKH